MKGRGRTAQARRLTENDIPKALRLTRTAAFYLVTFMVVTAGSIWLALQVAPLQTVSAAGETAQVGAAVPTSACPARASSTCSARSCRPSRSSTGPIRPLLKLTHITIDDEVARVLRSDSPRTLELNLSQQLAQGWTHYFEWETLIAAGFAVVALVAVAGIARQPHKKMAKTVVAGLAVVIAVNVGGVLLTAFQHARGAAQRQDPRRPGWRRPAHRAAAGRHPAAARRAGGGDRRLHRGRHRQPAPPQRHPAGPRLRPQQRVLRRRPGHGEQLERAEPGLQRRDRAERPARRPGAPRRPGGPAAARRGRPGHPRQGDHRQRRRGRRAVVDHDPALRGQHGVQRQGVRRLLQPS